MYSIQVNISFKIKDKNNIVQEIKLNCKCSTISERNNEKHKKENKYEHDK